MYVWEYERNMNESNMWKYEEWKANMKKDSIEKKEYRKTEKNAIWKMIESVRGKISISKWISRKRIGDEKEIVWIYVIMSAYVESENIEKQYRKICMKKKYERTGKKKNDYRKNISMKEYAIW